MIILNYFLISWVVSGIVGTLSEFINSKNLLINIIKLAMECSKCVSFWLTLIMTKDIFIAATVSFMMYLFGKIKFLNNTSL